MKLDIEPDSYVKSVFGVDYRGAYDRGIRYVIFDLDSTLLPFNDKEVGISIKSLFKYINKLGLKVILCSSGSNKRVEPVALELGVDYIAFSSKPFMEFSKVKEKFGDGCTPDNTMFIGDSLFFDIMQSNKWEVYSVLVDGVKGGNKFALYANNIIQCIIYSIGSKGSFKKNHYHRGYKER